jgi:hypothetical protein
MRRWSILAVGSLLASALAGCGVSSDVSRTVGARCDAMDECDERCLPPSDDHPGGFCTVSCLDEGDCPAGTACVDEAGGVCLFACASDRQCEFLGPGWSCESRDHIAGGEVDVCRG